MNTRKWDARIPKNITDHPINKPVLLIEDNNSVSSLIESKLREKWQLEIHVARSFQEAKKLLKQFRKNYMLAICDLHLPDAPNGEIVHLVYRAGLSSIIMTATPEKGAEKKLDDSSVFDYIVKSHPNSIDYLVEQVGRFQRNLQEKVLIVDDSPTFREILLGILANQNFQLLSACDGVEALAVLKANPDVKVVLTDFTMPNMNGLELTIEIRKQYEKSGLAVIGLSAEDEKSLALDFIRNGANDFLTKPFISEELITRINQNMDMLNYIGVIQDMAQRDYLTGLYNRRCFFDIGNAYLKDPDFESGEVCVALFDIDFFKKINDNYGHDAGDQVLKVFSSMMKTHFPESLVARIGGEEFVVLFDQPLPEVLVALDSFRLQLQERVIRYGEEVIPVTVSIGVNSTRNPSLDVMLKIADERLYQAKEKGRNRIESS